MKRMILLLLVLLPLSAAADPVQLALVTTSPGRQDLAMLKHCIIENNTPYCRSILTPSSYDIFDRFVSYKLMPCLPTDFVYDSEETVGPRTTVKATMPASNKTHFVFRIVFQDNKIDIPESFHVGLGDKWENKIQLAEQLYLMMRQNLGDKLTCDQLNDLVKK